MTITEIPSWIDKTSKLTGENFKKIFIFAVVNFPVPRKSARAIPLPENVEIPIKYKAGKTAHEIESTLADYNLMNFPPAGDFEERAVFVTSQNTVVLSFIDHVRNSIAHGRFNLVRNGKVDCLVMEDMNTNKECSARIVVKAGTLVRWIEEMHL